MLMTATRIHEILPHQLYSIQHKAFQFTHLAMAFLKISNLKTIIIIMHTKPPFQYFCNFIPLRFCLSHGFIFSSLFYTEREQRHWCMTIIAEQWSA